MNTQINEDYVSFETAKLLKEKGFDEKCFALYNPSEELIQCGVRLNNTQVGRVEGSYSAPTLQMAMKWLREVHKLHIIINPYTDKEGNNWSFIFDKYAYGCWQELGIYITDSWSSYEEACEAAIKYCLTNLI